MPLAYNYATDRAPAEAVFPLQKHALGWITFCTAGK